MSYLCNAPSDFTDEMTSGFVMANATLVRRVRGGVVRAAGTPPGEVALVIGGGSGHYPAFAGLVGPGLAHGAAMGNVFASPSAQQIYSVAREAASESGVLFSYGNYAGDVLNFDRAQERLNAEGVPCRTVVVTDDIMSASVPDAHKRRGIAGDLAVFRVAAWAAGQGRTLDQTWALASQANDRTRTIGVAFSGCTLPGADAPLFAVPAGRMALGMGIHGEPGLEEYPLPRADELAELLVDRILGDRPPDAVDLPSAAAVILNGLGSVKSEELFVLYREIAHQLEKAGVRIVQPDVGEMVTSFDMAGVSLTMMWLTDELERAWRSPAYTPGYRKGYIEPPAPAATPVRGRARRGASPTTQEPAGAEARECASVIALALRATAAAIRASAGELGRLDAVAGDGDHGIGMERGATAAADIATARAGDGAGGRTVLSAAADSWADKGGGTSGVLWGIALQALADRLNDTSSPSAADIASGATDAAAAIAAAGKARLGDKTMLDAMVPFAEALNDAVRAGVGLGEAWGAAAAAATAAAQSTAGLVPRVGRARPHAVASLGHPDAGATSFALIAQAVADVLAARPDGS